jgi:peptide/nickel transport system ATP-binding protein
MGLVGESGSGKSVTAKALMQLNPRNAVYDPGSRSRWAGGGRSTCCRSRRPKRAEGRARRRDLDDLSGADGQLRARHHHRRPDGRAADAAHRHVDKKAQAKAMSIEMLDRVGISDAAKRFDQYAFELSGGMRQRAMIAMALSTSPSC